MTTYTIGRQPLPIELADGSHLVARIAVSYGVRTNQRKPVLMFIDRVNRHLPTIDLVAQVAFSAILPAMNVGMAILATLSHIAKQGSSMAFLATYLGVHTSKRIAGFAVVKLRDVADRLPSRCGVALFTRHRHRTMRILRGSSRHPILPSKGGRADLDYKEQFQKQAIPHNFSTPIWI